MKQQLRSVMDTVLAHVRLHRRGHQPDLRAFAGQRPVKLHLGCGDVHLDGWINVDANPRSAADVVMDFSRIGEALAAASVDEIMMIHSLSYLRLSQARDLFAAIYRLLTPGGKFVVEFPDLEKCALAIRQARGNAEQYLEAVRAVYAFDVDWIADRRPYTPYAFGWAAWHLEQELRTAGFRDVQTYEPATHGQLLWRDSRVEATK
jgi:SAM-dependent methyltransferase